MSNLTKFFGYSFLTFIFFFIYVGSINSFEVLEENCYIKHNDARCYLELVNGKKCMTDSLYYYTCHKYDNNEIIKCFIRKEKYIDLCKVYISFSDLYNDFTNQEMF